MNLWDKLHELSGREPISRLRDVSLTLLHLQRSTPEWWKDVHHRCVKKNRRLMESIAKAMPSFPIDLYKPAWMRKLILAMGEEPLDGRAFEELICKFAMHDRGHYGGFYTPQAVSDVMAGLVALNRTDIATVYDPACGSGSLLLNVRRKAGVRRLYGTEVREDIHRLCRQNMWMHGLNVQDFFVHRGDSLVDDSGLLPDLRMDAVVSAPPFTVRWDPVSDHRFEGYAVPPRSVADYAFLLHGLHYLKEDGVMVILLHPGALWRGGAETIVRRRLLENDYVDAVISLPGGLFYTTGCPACIIVLKKRRKASGVLFIEGPATEGKGHRWHLTCNQVNFILRTYRDRSSVRASLEEIAGEGLYSLSPAKFGTLVPRPSHEPKIG